MDSVSQTYIMNRTTEADSLYRHLEQTATADLLNIINAEDHKVSHAVERAIPAIETLVEVIVQRLRSGGRLFYIGAGTSGRLGILDASECPPTFGVSHDLVIGLIAGGDTAIRRAVEHAEDDRDQAWLDLVAYGISDQDVVVGIAASGSTPYVVAGLQACNQRGIATGCITCNKDSSLAAVARHPITVVVGPEVITGSTRMKAGTAQKMVLNMITTTTMIRLGHVLDNKMVDMQLSNDKLIDRGTKQISDKTGIDYDKARELLLAHGSVRAVFKFLDSL